LRDTDKDLQKFYNDISKQFADEWYSNDSLLPVLKSFVSLLNSNARVLDFGCGAGYESMRLHNLGVEVVGIDYSIEPIKIAREKNPQCRFEVMDFRRIVKSIGSLMECCIVIIHVDDNDLIDVFSCR
jgi:2-polyprenyl-3-methyl-5-hydroxy-6-metoxy-1,4-benzoquinol methylase